MFLAELLLIEDIDLKIEMKHYFDEVSHKYFSEYVGKFPYPKFVVRTTKSRLGQFNPDKNEIIVNGLVSLEGLKKTVWHEALHYYEWWVIYDGGKNKQVVPRWGSIPKGGHGQFFVDAMNQINSKEGNLIIYLKGTADELDMNAVRQYNAAKAAKEKSMGLGL